MKRAPAVILGLVSTTTLVAMADPHNVDRTRDGVFTAAAGASDAGLAVTHVDERRGLPTFTWSTSVRGALPSASAEAAAIHHLAMSSQSARLRPAALATAIPVAVHDTSRGGIIVTLRQHIGGVEVMHSDAKVLMHRNLDLVAISGALHPHATATNVKSFPMTAEVALAGALDDLTGLTVAPSALSPVKAKGRYARFEWLSPSTLYFTRPARIKAVYLPLGDRLEPAYFLEVFTQDGVDQSDFRYIVSAVDGRVLVRQNLIAHQAYDYRVWANTTAPYVPLDGPHENFTPHPTGVPDGSVPATVEAALISMEGFNHNPQNTSDPWLPNAATETVGNNVDAFVDAESPDGFSGNDFRATVSGNTVDHPYVMADAPDANATQSMAVVTNLFFVTNWMHDWFYDSGFDEDAGNAQALNFGRGGEEGDVMRAEAQDYSGRNNANMSTPSDGESPRMQMYLWNGASDRTVAVSPMGLDVAAGTASFGPQTFDVTADVLIADDATDDVTDGCEPLVIDATGFLVFARRGGCSFWTKAANAEAAGAVGVILGNNAPGGAPGMGGTPGVPINIPILSVTEGDADALVVAVGQETQTATLMRSQEADRDSSLDNAIIAHEWGHFIHNRLESGGNLAHRAMGEGWGDFLAIYLSLEEGEALDGAYAASMWATGATDNHGYFGIRRFPYSTDFAVNALTFRHISTGEPLPNTPAGGGPADNAQVHNAGEIWATMLWEGYTRLVARSLEVPPVYDYAEARRRMADYIVAGLVLTPRGPTWTEARDGIIAAAYASDPSDALILAEAFATRGMGTCAVPPPRNSGDFTGLTESFELAPVGSVQSLALTDDTKTCDQDGLLDAGEEGTLTIVVGNTGLLDLTGATIDLVASGATGITLPASVPVPDVGPFDSVTVTVPVSLAEEATTSAESLVIDATLHATGACDSEAASETFLVHLDEALASSTIDAVDTIATTWTKTGEDSDTIWERLPSPLVNGVWQGDDLSSPSDTALESPTLFVSDNAPFVLTFDHLYSFEPDPNTFWDGGVIEVSVAGGPWQDASTWVDPGYDGVITDTSGNVLANREAFSGRNADYPNFETVSLDFGTQFSGLSIRVRFRIGTDMAAGDAGWTLDNIRVEGTNNTPFATQSAEGGVCNLAPIADAGEKQYVAPGDSVSLDASGSTDPEGDPLSFGWTQIGGSPVTMVQSPNNTTASLVAPNVTIPTQLTFEVAVSDASSSNTDTVAIIITPPETPGTGGGGPVAGGGPPAQTGAGGNDADPMEDADAGCGCSVPARPSSPWGMLAFSALGLIALGRRRRR